MFSTDFMFRQQENLVDNQKCQAGFWPLCNKIAFFHKLSTTVHARKSEFKRLFLINLALKDKIFTMAAAVLSVSNSALFIESLQFMTNC